MTPPATGFWYSFGALITAIGMGIILWRAMRA